MDKKVLALAGIVAMVSVGTYVVLTLVKPHKHEEAKVAEVYSADQIFQGTLDPNAADETPASGTASEAAAEPPASAETTAATEAPASSNADAMTTPVEAGTAQASTPTPPPAQEQVAAAEPALAQPAEPTQPEPAAAVEPPAPVAPVEPAPKRVKHAPAKKSSAAAAPAAKAWWPAEKPDQLSLIYAGSASFKKAIVLMFNGAFFKPDSPNAALKVVDASGAPVSGTWELGENNRRMLVFPVSGPGRYTVSVGADLTDSKDRKLGTALSGTVVVN